MALKRAHRCRWCNAEFYRPPSQLGGGFCSRSCSSRSKVGSKNGRWRGGRRLNAQGYVVVTCPEHPHAVDGYMQEHRLIVERALGHILRRSAPVHHWNEIKTDNRRSNLVACQDDAYHKLLHARMRTLRAGGNPHHAKLCQRCATVKPKADFSRQRSRQDGLQSTCKACQRSASAARRADPVVNERMKARMRTYYHSRKRLRVE